MNFQRKKVATALAFIAGSGALAATTAHGQTSSPDIRVEVTGSNIKRVQAEGALPVTVITRQDIDRSGATTPMELLQQISSNNSFGAVSMANSVGATTLSAQTASLRGLGGGRTLVLLNGHRLEGFAGEIQGVQGVNLAAIPFSAIERVEVLKDGASAIYGSDAIGGVINFITRSDYVGADAMVQYGTPTRGGGGDQWLAQVSAGWGDLSKDRWNAWISGQYTEQKALDQADRDFSHSSYRPDIGLVGVSSNTWPGNIRNRALNPVGPREAGERIGVVTNRNGAARIADSAADCAPNIYVNDDILGRGCFFDPSAVHGINMIPHDKQYNVFAAGKFQITPDWQAYLQGAYSHDESNLVIQPGPVSELFPFGPQASVDGTILMQPTSPYYPHNVAAAAGIDGQPLNVRYRTFDNGFRDLTDTNEHWNVTGGFKGSWLNWDWDASLFYSKGKTTEKINNGFQDYRLLYPILQSGVVNFFGDNTPDVVDLLRTANFHGDAITGDSKNYGAQVKTSGEIWKLPAGPLAMAIGAETRKEKLEQHMAEPLQSGFLTGYGGEIKDVQGDRTQWAAFTEFNIPIVRTLEGTVAVRYDHYDDFGATTNPKFSLRWQPTQQLLLRASYGKGFLAPSLYQLFTPNIHGVTQPGLSDPVRCPITGDTGFDCQTQFGVTFGGNLGLKPEKSENTSVGFVFEPVPQFSFAIDWFKIKLADAITNGISPLTVLGDLSQFGSLVTRGPSTPDFPNLPGRIIDIDQRYINLGALKIQGYDIDLRYRSPAYDWGRMIFTLAGTYYNKYDAQNPDGTYSGQVGTAFGTVVTGIVPRWKHYISATWERGPWASTLAQTYQTSYTDQQTDLDGNFRTVGSLSLWDLQGSYSGFKNVKLTLGVKNLFDTDPPKSNQQSTFIVGFDPTYYDPRARFVYGSVGYTFK